MSLELSGPEGIFVGLEIANLSTSSWKYQIIGSVDNDTAVNHYGHGLVGAVMWMQFTVTENDSNVVVRGEWDLSKNSQAVLSGTDATNLSLMTTPPTNKKPFIDPGIGTSGSILWLRYCIDAGGQTPNKEFRFVSPYHVNLAQVATWLKDVGGHLPIV